MRTVASVEQYGVLWLPTTNAQNGMQNSGVDESESRPRERNGKVLMSGSINILAIHGSTSGVRPKNWSEVWRVKADLPNVNWFEYNWEQRSDSIATTRTRLADIAVDSYVVQFEAVWGDVCRFLESNAGDKWIVVGHSIGCVLGMYAIGNISPKCSRSICYVTMGNPYWFLSSPRLAWLLRIGLVTAPPLWQCATKIKRWWNISGLYDPIARFGTGGVPGAKNMWSFNGHRADHYVCSNSYFAAMQEAYRCLK